MLLKLRRQPAPLVGHVPPRPIDETRQPQQKPHTNGSASTSAVLRPRSNGRSGRLMPPSRLSYSLLRDGYSMRRGVCVLSF